MYPVAKGTMINVGAFHSRPDLVGTKFPGEWVSKVEEADLIKAHENWEPELRAIMEVSVGYPACSLWCSFSSSTTVRRETYALGDTRRRTSR